MLVAQSWLTLCDPIDCSPPGSSVLGFPRQEYESWDLRTEFTEVTSDNSCFCGKVKVKSLSCVRLFATPGTVAYKFPPSMEFSRQEYWSGFHFLLQGKKKKSSQPRGSNLGLPHCKQTLLPFTFYLLPSEPGRGKCLVRLDSR